MQLEEVLDWSISPAAPHRAGRRRDQQLRRREPAVPGGARPRSGCRPSGLSVAQVVEALRAVERQRRRRLHRAQPRVVSSSAPRGLVTRPRRPAQRGASGPRQQGTPITIANGGRRAVLGLACAAAPPRCDGEGEVVVGVALMLHRRELARRDRGGQGERLRDHRADACPRERRSSHFMTDRCWSTARIHTVVKQPRRGRGAGHRSCCLCCSATCAPGVVVATRPSRCRCCFAAHR